MMNVNAAMTLAKSTAEELRVKARGTELEKRLLEALSGENWGASSSILNQIAQDTYDYEKYPVIMKAIWSAMENTATSWRKVFKGLALLDHLIKNGNERIIEETRDHMRRIRPLGDFNFYEAGIDRGSGVREKSKNIVELIQDNDRIREERVKARQLREKFSGGVGSGSSTPQYGGYGGNSGGSGSFSSSGGGIGSYSSGGIDSNMSSSGRRKYEGHGSGSSRYSDSGGGARTANTGRYSDEATDVTPPAPLKSYSQSSEKKEKPKKFDIKIKSSGAAPAAPAAPAPVAPEPDLFGVTDSEPPPSAPASDFDLFQSSPAPPAAAAPPVVDLFAAAPAPPLAPMAPQASGFGAMAPDLQPQPFQSPTGMQQPSMGMQPMMQAYGQGNYSSPPQGQPPMGQPMMQPNQPPMMPQQMSMMQPNQPPLMGMGAQQTAPQPAPVQDGFGDFQAVPTASKPAIGSSLVDLGGLSLNDKKDKSSGGGGATPTDDKSKFKSHDMGIATFNTTQQPGGLMMGSGNMGMPPRGQQQPMQQPPMMYMQQPPFQQQQQPMYQQPMASQQMPPQQMQQQFYQQPMQNQQMHQMQYQQQPPNQWGGF